MERRIPIPEPYDLRASLSSLMKAGMTPPVARWVDDRFYKATSTPDGPATLSLQRVAGGVQAEAWGPGAQWVLDHTPQWLGVHDDPESFEPRHPLLRALHRRDLGMHLGHTGRVFDALLFVLLGQRVTTKGAMASRRSLFRAYGEVAPGPVELLLPPSPTRLKSVAYFDLHPMNIERRRATTLLHAARVARRLEECRTMSLPSARARLGAIQGIGPWTIGLVAGAALGDRDAVAIGDYHLKNTVCHLLAGEPRGTDERMLELLEPYPGHRRRVVQLLARSGKTAPRYGPRLAVNDVRGR